jgi:aldehyde dehydrogenase (NAD+)
MREYLKFYIDGHWVEPLESHTFDVVNPATEEVAGRISLGTEGDVDRAVKAARRAFTNQSRTTREERITLLERIAQAYEARYAEICAAVTEEMGSPTWSARDGQVALPLEQIRVTIDTLRRYEFEELRGRTMIRKEPIGVCGLITPWNWPALAVMTKVLPALATGCTVVLKPSEYSPFSAHILAQVMDEAGVPPGVFNLIYGEGPVVGAALSAHTDIDLVSITGSTRAGIDVARAAATTVKRVHQELGGKSPNVILEDADIEKSVTNGVRGLMFNAGQNCLAPSRRSYPNLAWQRLSRSLVLPLPVSTSDRPIVRRSLVRLPTARIGSGSRQ